MSREVGAALPGLAAFKDPVETLDCQAQTCPHCSHAPEFMHIHRTNWFKWPIGRPTALAICSLFIAGGCRDTSPVVYELQSSSMAPQFRGPRFAAACQNCDQSIEIAAERSDKEWPVRCPYCGGNCQVSSQLTSGDRVEVHQNANLARLDVVAIKRRDQAVLLKRIWGLPGEQIEIANGELSIDGHMFQKSLPDLRRVAVPLAGGSWSTHAIPGDSTRETHKWTYKSPAPVYPDESKVADWLVPSPLTDEQPGSPGSGKLAISEDICLRIKLREQVEWIAVDYFYRGKMRSVLVSSEDNPLAGEALTLHVSVRPSATTEVAFCDGRVLIGTDAASNGEVFSLAPFSAIHAGTPEEYRSAEISVSAPAGAIHSTEAFRDLILRSTHLDPRESEQYSTLDSEHFFVLGDNQPISLDSRNDLGQIRRNEILGVVDKVPSSETVSNR